MKKYYTLLSMMIILTIISGKTSIAQTVTVFDYENWIPVTQCNIFSPGPLINGRQHLTTVGQPVYDITNHTINLECTPTGNKGTEYQIEYPFKKGFKYKITVRAGSVISGTPAYPNYLRTMLTSQVSSLPLLCSGMQAINTATTGANIVSVLNNATSYTDYYFDYLEQSSASTYLRIGAVPFSGASLQTMFIRKVTIEETAVNPDLVLSPQQVTTVCGTDFNQMFTVTNPYNASGITSYEWNLGSAVNGWKYNGNAAPQSISTTANTLSLTADGCRSGNLSDVTVTVHRNGAPYKTYTATASTTQPVLSITGPSSFCSGTADYSINNLPCNAQVTWSITAGTLSCTNCNQTTLLGVTGGGAVLTATVQACGSSPIILQKNISSGMANNSFDVVLYLPLPEGCYDAWSFYVFKAENPSGTGHTGYQWSYRLQGTSNETIVSSNSETAAITFNNPGVYEVVVRAVNSCGVGSYESIKIVEVVDFCSMSGWPSNLVASPVPANNTLNISTRNDGRSLQTKTVAISISRIQIIDKLGNVRIDRRLSGKMSGTSLDVSGLANDLYVLKVFDGKKWWSKMIIVQH